MKKVIIILLLACCVVNIGCKKKEETGVISEKPAPKPVEPVEPVEVVEGYGFYATELLAWPVLGAQRYVTHRVVIASNAQEAIENTLAWYKESEIYNPTHEVEIRGKLGKLYDSYNVNYVRFREKLLKRDSASAAGKNGG